MTLTAKQEAFCLAYVESGNATDAYRKAGYSPAMSEKTVNEAASRLLKNSKVAARIDALRKPAAEAATMTLAGHLARLEELSKAAEDAGNYSAAINAEIARGKAAGVHIEKSEHMVTTRELPASVDDFV